MIRWCFILLLFSTVLKAQSVQDLTVEKIMRDPKWIGVAPNHIFWSPDSKTVNFYWNPEAAISDSLYSITLTDPTPRKLSMMERRNLPARFGCYNRAFTKMTYEKHGDIFLYDVPSGKLTQVTNTVAQEYGPYFSGDGKKVIFTIGHDAFSWDLAEGKYRQLTNFEKGSENTPQVSEQEKWLKADQLETFQVLKERTAKHNLKKKNKKAEQHKKPKLIYLDHKIVEMVQVSPDEQFVLYEISKNSNPKKTIVPNYVTVSGFTEDIPSRTKVGEAMASSELFIYDISADTV
jgi:hypothetical protein